jgi:hypothetical protein
MTTRYARRGAAPAIRPVATARPGYASRGRSGSVETFLAEARATGAAIGAAYRAAQLSPDKAWVARQVAIGHAASSPAFRSAVAEYDRRTLAQRPVSAVRTPADAAWVQMWLDRREAHVRTTLAPLLGLDPDAAVEAAQAQLLGRTGLGSLAI